MSSSRAKTYIIIIWSVVVSEYRCLCYRLHQIPKERWRMWQNDISRSPFHTQLLIHVFQRHRNGEIFSKLHLTSADSNFQLPPPNGMRKYKIRILFENQFEIRKQTKEWNSIAFSPFFSSLRSLLISLSFEFRNCVESSRIIIYLLIVVSIHSNARFLIEFDANSSVSIYLKSLNIKWFERFMKPIFFLFCKFIFRIYRDVVFFSFDFRCDRWMGIKIEKKQKYTIKCQLIVALEYH